jgi:DNA-binding response OmpR family regulator
MRPNRRPTGDDDYITKHHVVTTLRARIRGLVNYYRRAQKEQKKVITTVTQWARKEVHAAVGALRLVKPKSYNS